jgi:hypothetical protein
MRIISALVLASALTFAAAPVFAQSQQEAAAQVRFGKGRDYFMDKKYAEALVEFRAASELFASPNTRFYIGRCERELGHPGRAYVELQRAASDAADRARTDPKYATTRDSARQEAQALEGKFGKLVVKGKEVMGLAVTVGGAPFSTAAFGVATPTDPGSVEVSATAKGKLPFKKTVAIKAGDTVEVAIDLQNDPNASEGTPTPDNPPNGTPDNPNPNGTIAETSNPPPSDGDNNNVEVEHRGGGVRLASLFVIGAGVAGFVGFAVFAATAQGQYDQLKTLEATCGMPGKAVCPTQETVTNRVSEGQRNQTIANVALGIGIGGFVVGGFMFAIGGPTTVTKRKGAASWKPMLEVGPTGAFGGVQGAF